MILLLLLLYVATIVIGQGTPQNEYKIEFKLKAGKVGLHLTADKINPNAVRVSITTWLALYENYVRQTHRFYKDDKYKAKIALYKNFSNVKQTVWLFVSWKH